MNTAVSAQMSDQHNLNDDIQYINGLLKKFGLEEFPFAEIFSETTNRASNLAALQHKARICSLLIQLLHSKQKEEVFRNDSEDRIVRLLEETRNMEAMQKRQEERVKLQEREIVSLRQSQQVGTERYRQLESSAVSLRDELTKLKQVCLQKEKQFQHDLRKREKEMEKLKDQLAAVLKDIPLREQKSEVQYMQNGVNSREVNRVLENITQDEEAAVEEDMDMQSTESVPRSAVIEMENYRLRQILSYTYGSMIQLFMELFPDVEVDQSLLALLESNPVDWFEEAIGQKMEEIVELLRQNVNGVALKQTASVLKDNEETISRLTSQFQAAQSTISSQTETIRLLELKLAKMDEYRSRMQALEIENAQLQSNTGTKSAAINAPGTPNWRRRSRSRSLSPFSTASSDFGNSPVRGRQMSRSRSRSRSMSPRPTSGFFLRIRKLTRNVSEAHIREIFGNYGEIKAVNYPMHPITGYPNGSATVEYANEESLAEALQSMDGGQIDGNVIQCLRANTMEIERPHKSPRKRNHRHSPVRRPYGRADHYPPRRGRSRSPRGRPYRRSPSPGYRRFSRSRSPPRRPMSRSPPPRRFSRSPPRRPISRSPPPRRYSRSPPPRRYSRSRSPSRNYGRPRSPPRNYRNFSHSPSPIRRRLHSPSPVHGRP